jgi:hypothetical protein
MPTKRRVKPKKKSRVIRARPSLKLDLGSGQHPAEGFKGVDIAPMSDFQFDLCSGADFPWEDSSVDELRCSHFIEHIPMAYLVHEDGTTQDAFFRFFDECWRIIKPGGSFHLVWPALWNDRAFQDPTHRRFIPVATMLYLNAEWRKANALDHYNVKCHWAVVSHSPTILTQPRFEGDIPINQRPDLVQRRMFIECVNVVQDNHVVLKAVK